MFDLQKPKEVKAEEKDNEIVADELKPVIPLPNKELQGAFGENGRAVVIPVSLVLVLELQVSHFFLHPPGEREQRSAKTYRLWLGRQCFQSICE